MKYVKSKPYVMLSRDDISKPASKVHFRVVLGKKGKCLVSASVTHAPKVNGAKVYRLPDNIEKSYVVGRVYVRDPSEYWVPKYPDSYEVSSRNRIVFENIAKKTKVSLK